MRPGRLTQEAIDLANKIDLQGGEILEEDIGPLDKPGMSEMVSEQLLTHVRQTPSYIARKETKLMGDIAVALDSLPLEVQGRIAAWLFQFVAQRVREGSK